MIDGIAAIANSHVFVANAHYVIGDLRAWGWVALILGLAPASGRVGVVMIGNQAARWFGSSHHRAQRSSLSCSSSPPIPFWALTIIAVRRVRAIRALRLRQPG